MGMLWYVVLALLFMAVVILAVPAEKTHAPAPDPRGVMLQLKQDQVTSPALKAP
jgi:hypothetical protein